VEFSFFNEALKDNTKYGITLNMLDD